MATLDAAEAPTVVTVKSAEQQKTEINRFKELTEIVLPKIAREQRWPVRFDHCFKRICLDNAFGDVWHKHLLRPAERHLEQPQLSRVITIAEQMVAEGIPALERLNCLSLQWRRKRR